ncbi:MAG: spermidine/putrescine ABC transporter substrate-binding protein [Leptolyngbyaceae cyanobacterium SM1_3_5]|nr:spermidine/putrescine ABC transporter substrate-binding protein [Leptolyngbyaceae cyanobacterium SM1_3_5]
MNAPSRSPSSRRRFLQFSAAALSGVALANCRPQIADPGGNSGGSGSQNSLSIYSWSNYFDDELLSSFTAETGIRIVADVFDSNEAMLARVQAGGGAAYSIIYPSDYMVQQMIELDLLTELDKSRLEGLDRLLDQWQNPVYDPNNAHSVPTTWGTTGLVFSRSRLNPAPADWDFLWEQQSQLNGRLTLFNDVREVMGAVLKSLGFSYNSTDPAQIEAAYNRLRELKPAIASFTTDGWRDQIVTGDLLVAMGYSSDAIDLATEAPDIEYVIPASGSSLWTDTMVIPKTAPNPEGAYAWMNFLLKPENAARAVERLKFATPNQAAIDLLSPELRNNKNLFPPAEVLAKCEGIAPVGAATELYDRYWTQITSA